MIQKACLLAVAVIILLACNSNSQQRNAFSGNQPETRTQQPGEQRQMNPEQMADRMVARMKSELNLNEKQEGELKTFFASFHQERQKELEKVGENREARRESMLKHRKTMDDKIKSVLTEEQYKKYQENEANRRREGSRRGHRGRAEGTANR